MDRIREGVPWEIIEDGDWVKMDSTQGRVEVIKGDGAGSGESQRSDRLCAWAAGAQSTAGHRFAAAAWTAEALAA
jgi:hypothetical protein